ncbi:PLP-dependent aminotransferase family protein [Nitriliruptor alkaliphilus]|uniref:MocR-like pyridoxine biosynthesis transcription factor PdxR n=1 Tax=Nitriliruptor alkaliphilus TaxID=427918 RepID=UPI000A48A97F|nr:PLP-dependent aminotransferase family protein [Nitriliruptor alkaliphilus]
MDLALQLDPSLPPGRALELELRGAIRGGRLPAGQRLPSTRALAQDLGVARGTVVAVYEQLSAEGWLESRQGAGTAVAAVPTATAPPVPPPAAPAPTSWRPLRPGVPDLSRFPRQAWARAVQRSLADAPTDALAYGEPGGPASARHALAGYLGRTRGVDTDPDDLLFTTGLAQGLSLVAHVLAARGARRVALEDPGSPPFRTLLQAAGLEPVPVPVDGQGLVTDALPDAAAVLVTPAHQFPVGVALAPQRRHDLITWAGTGGRLVLEDDYDAEFRYDRRNVKAVQPLAPDAVVHLGSVSKTLAPALRLGWVVVPPRMREEVLAAKRHHDISSTTLNALAFAELLDSGAYDRHLRTLRTHYRRRHERVAAILTDHGWTLPGVPAGLHLLAVEPEPGLARDTARRADELGLDLPTLASYRTTPSDEPDGLVIGFAAIRAGEERETLTRLDRALRRTGP